MNALRLSAPPAPRQWRLPSLAPLLPALRFLCAPLAPFARLLARPVLWLASVILFALGLGAMAGVSLIGPVAAFVVVWVCGSALLGIAAVRRRYL